MLSTNAIFMLLGVFITTINGVPYSKYGRSCKDIGCRSNEVCVMAEDPCNIHERDLCGRYPTCQLTGGESCTTRICPSGQYCKTENGKATCVNTTPALAYNSAGISTVNGQRTNGEPKVPADRSSDSRNVNRNPYDNSNIPPNENLDHLNNYHSIGSGNPVYPPFPANNGIPPNYNSNNNYGYPDYPSHNNNNNNNYGYPQYPTSNNNNNNNNRPNYNVDRYGYPVYPAVPPHPDDRYHNTYPQNNLGQHNPGWNTDYLKKFLRGNGASVFNFSEVFLIGSFILSVVNLRILRI